MTGMSDKLRQNFTLMRDMGRYLFQPPQEKVDAIGKFIRRLKATAEVRNPLEVLMMMTDEDDGSSVEGLRLNWFIFI